MQNGTSSTHNMSFFCFVGGLRNSLGSLMEEGEGQGWVLAPERITRLGWGRPSVRGPQRGWASRASWVLSARPV